MDKKHLVTITIIYIALCAYYYIRMVSMTHPGFPLDDSWIHQVFAKNIAGGHGFSFNPGRSIAADTAPLWAILLVPAWMIFGPVTGGLIMGVILQGLALLAVYKLTRQITEDSNLAFLATLFSLLFWPVIWCSMSGMETGLYSALSLWGMYLFFKSKKPGDIHRYGAYLLFTLSFMSRPECVLFIAAAVIHDLVIAIKSKDKTVIPWAIKVLIILAFTAPYLAFNYSTVGIFFPNTFSVKVMGRDLISALMRNDLKGVLHALAIYPYFYLQHFYRSAAMVNPVIVLALVPGIVKFTGFHGEDRSKRVMFVLLFLVYVPLMGIFAPVASATWQNFRYVTNLLPMMIIIGIAGLFWKTKAEYRDHKRILFIMGLILAAGGIFLTFFFGFFNKAIIPFLVQNPSFLSTEDYQYLTGVIQRVGLGTLLLAAMVFIGYGYSFGSFRKFIGSPPAKKLIIAATLSGCLILTIIKAQYYANNVRNVNECDVAAGKFLARIGKPGDVVAVNDVGAIGYYSEMEIFDLWGLISREITVEMLTNDFLTFEYMLKNKQVHYMAIAPGWFTYLPGRTDIFQPIAELKTENNTILAQDKTVVYRATWPGETDE
ncbi:MAG: glycosyltransferase family 39 protein [Candidatus Zixiibacteriota bacterium]|nr:MAG: glycosyltransferase family 39 protein [candidate division Zixibacteria bacterium]